MEANEAGLFVADAR